MALAALATVAGMAHAGVAVALPKAALGAAAAAHVFGGLMYGKLRDVIARQTSATTPI